MKYIKITACIFFFAIVSIHSVVSQTTGDIDNAVRIFNNYSDSTILRTKQHKTGNILFRLYKQFISSQDAGNCPFYPSCSEYMMQAIQRRGVILGIIDAFDRLSRCNGFNMEIYPVQPEKRRLYDPVEY